MNSKMKKIISILLFVALVVSALALTSCARQDDEQTRQIAANLMERAYVLNEAYYGNGLPYDENELAEGNYYYVTEDSPIRVRNDLIVETREVFSDNIATNLIGIYLDGTSSMGVVVFARYLTGASGYLTVYKDYDNVVKNVTKYDTSTIEIVKNSKNKVIFTAKTADGSKSTEIELVFENDGWKINSPSY